MSNFNFDNWGSWGVGDFYAGNEQELIDAINNGEPFDTGWHGFKKELEEMRIIRHEDMSVEIIVAAYMDSAFEDSALIYDCLTDDEAKLLTDEMIKEIRECLMEDMDFCEDTTKSLTKFNNPSYEEIMNSANDLANMCKEELHENYLSCMGTTLYVLYGHPEDVSFISKRIVEAG